MQRFFALILIIVAAITHAFAQTSNETQQFTASIEALAQSPRAVAYRKFVELHTIARPHPEREIEAFIQRASRGDSEAFAFVAMMVWQEYVGFRGPQVVGKLALMKAMKDGSSLGAYFIAETFVKTGAANSEVRVERYLDSLHWFGVAAGMGETRANEKALEMIKLLSTNLPEDQRRQLHYLYNKGMEEGVANRKKAPRQ